MGSDADEFIAKLEQSFSYEQSTRTYSKLFEVDGLCIEVVSESEDFLSKMTRALAHVAVLHTRAIDLTIELHAGSRPEFFNWIHTSFGNQVQRLQTDRVMCMVNPGIDESVPTLSFFDSKKKHAIFWIQDDARIPWYELAVPFRIIFHWFFDRHGLTLVHGASIGNERGGILLVGKGGSGKTSTALAVLDHDDLLYASDDYVLLKLSPVPIAISLYCTAKVKHHNRVPIGEKEVLFVYETHKESVAKQLEIRAVVLPVIAHANKTAWRTLHSAQALLALAPSTIFQLLPEDTHHDSFGVLSQLVRRIPAIQLHLSENASEIREKLALLLGEL